MTNRGTKWTVDPKGMDGYGSKDQLRGNPRLKCLIIVLINYYERDAVTYCIGCIVERWLVCVEIKGTDELSNIR